MISLKLWRGLRRLKDEVLLGGTLQCRIFSVLGIYHAYDVVFVFKYAGKDQ